MLIRYLMPGTCQMPDRSGWPLALRGAGADRFGLPFGSRGTPAVGYSCHCAVTDVHITTMTMVMTADTAPVFMVQSSRVDPRGKLDPRGKPACGPALVVCTRQRAGANGQPWPRGVRGRASA